MYMRAFFFSLWETVEMVVVAAIALFLIRNFLAQPFVVSGASMEPNFSSGDYLLIDEITYRFRAPERGEVVVFRYPGNPSVYYIKRIIGLPGDRLVFKGGRVEVFDAAHSSGSMLDETYLPKDFMTTGQEVTVKSGEYFVLGDNRAYSYDSRSWGDLNKNLVVGLVRFRLWPVNKVIAVERPAY